MGNEEIIVGERMSPLIDPEKVVFKGSEMYESEIALLQDKPLDTGRMLYVKLRRALPIDVNVEVVWNHFNNTIFAYSIDKGSYKHQIMFNDRQMARIEKIILLDRMVEYFLEEEA